MSNFDDQIDSPENPYKHYDQSYLEDYLKNFLKLDKKAIGIPSYSNLGFGILGYTICKIYEMSYEDLIQKFIFCCRSKIYLFEVRVLFSHNLYSSFRL